MKKFSLLLVLFAVAPLAMAGNKYDPTDKKMFNHLAAGLNVGTAGIGIDVATPICKWVQVRAGYNFPTIKMNTELDVSDYYDIPSELVSTYAIPEEFDVKGELNFGTGKLLFDIHPFKKLPVFLCVGAYFGNSDFVTAYNKSSGALSAITEFNKVAASYGLDKIGLEFDDYILEPDSSGNMKAAVQVKSFRPYVGLGTGWAVPNGRVGFMFEAGVQCWGSPKVTCNGDELEASIAGDDGGEIIEIVNGLTVWPVINFRISVKLF